MAVFTFSTQDKKSPKDKQDIEELKAYCNKRNINFSSLVVQLLLNYKKENVDASNR